MLVEFLSKFHSLTALLSASSHPTINLVRTSVDTLIKRCDRIPGISNQSYDQFRQELKKCLKDRFKECFYSTSLVNVAAFLDPRTRKMQFMESYQRNQLVTYIRQLLPSIGVRTWWPIREQLRHDCFRRTNRVFWRRNAGVVHYKKGQWSNSSMLVNGCKKSTGIRSIEGLGFSSSRNAGNSGWIWAILLWCWPALFKSASEDKHSPTSDVHILIAKHEGTLYFDIETIVS